MTCSEDCTHAAALRDLLLPTIQDFRRSEDRSDGEVPLPTRTRRSRRVSRSSIVGAQSQRRSVSRPCGLHSMAWVEYRRGSGRQGVVSSRRRWRLVLRRETQPGAATREASPPACPAESGLYAGRPNRMVSMGGPRLSPHHQTTACRPHLRQLWTGHILARRRESVASLPCALGWRAERPLVRQPLPQPSAVVSRNRRAPRASRPELSWWPSHHV